MGKYQPFNDLPANQFEQLKRDIEVRGVLLPVLVDERGLTIDGHQRRRACAELGTECPTVVVEGMTEEEKIGLAFTLNLFRRHLSGTERARAVMQLAQRGLSTRRMSDLLGMSKSVIHRDLQEMEESGEFERPDRVIAKNGRDYPAHPERPLSRSGTTEEPPEGVDANGEIEAGGTSTREDEDTDPASSPAAEDGGVTPPAPSRDGTRSPSQPETIEERNAREAEQRRVDRNVDFGKFLVGMWAMFRGERSAALFLDGWVPDECPQWQVEPHKPLFTADGIRDVAHLLEKLATEWESRV